MLIKGINSVSFEGSYVLGWQRCPFSLVVDMEMLLTASHVLSRPFNEDNESGSYERARLVCKGLEDVCGLPSNIMEVVYNDVLSEYKDFCEICGVIFHNDYCVLETDDIDITIYASEVSLEFMR